VSQPLQLVRKLGPFTVHEALGQGGMASVFRATDEQGRSLALKVMDPRLAADAQFVARFQREARISASLQHPHIVRVIAAGESGGTYYLASELVTGGTLERLTSRGHRLPSAVAVEFTSQLLEALAHAHGKGVVHRDLKPANLLLTPDGQVKVTDFGIARAIDETNLTQTGAVFGTARYMSPEQVTGAALDHRSDLFTTGVILYELLAGVPPTGDASVEMAMARLMSRQLTPLLEVNPLVPPALVRVVEQLMAWEPDKRFQSAEAALAALKPMRDAALLAHRTLAAEYVAQTDALDAELRRAEAAHLLARAKAALAQQPPLLEAAILSAHLALELEPGLQEAAALRNDLSTRVRFVPAGSSNPKVIELEQHLTMNPRDEQVLAQLVQLYRTEGNYLRAAQCMRRYIALRPDDTYMGAQLARLAGSDWVPTLPPKGPAAAESTGRLPPRPWPSGPGAEATRRGLAAAPMPAGPMPAGPMPAGPPDAGAPVVVYKEAPGGGPSAAPAWLGLVVKVVAVAGVLGLGFYAVKSAIRSAERAEEARFKQMEIDSQKAAAAMLEQQLKLQQRFEPSAADDAGYQD
jgi:hypothetical protein